MAMKELPCSAGKSLAESKGRPILRENCFRQGKIRIQSTHSAKSAMPMTFPSMKWIFMAGEEFYAEIKRSTNGGGENSRRLKEDDFYELFLAVRKYMIFAKNVSIDECGKLHGQCLMNLRRACHVV